MIEIFDRQRRRVAIAENAHTISEQQRINAVWYLHFSLPFKAPKNAYCKPFYYVRHNGGELYRIVPETLTADETGNVAYQCEHVLATLIDNILFGYHVVGKDHKLANYLGEVLKDGYRSPEAALGEIVAKGMAFDTKLSTRTLYRYVQMEIIPGISNLDLPHRRNKKDKKKKEKPRAARSAQGKSIEERPKTIHKREEAGHWEMDTVLSAKDGSLERVLALTERATRNQINLKIKNGETVSVVAALDALEQKLGAAFPTVFRSITVDNAPSLRMLKVWSDLAYAKEKNGRRSIIATRIAPANGAPTKNKTA